MECLSALCGHLSERCGYLSAGCGFLFARREQNHVRAKNKFDPCLTRLFSLSLRCFSLEFKTWRITKLDVRGRKGIRMEGVMTPYKYFP